MGDGHVNEPRSKTKTAHVQNGRCFSRFACGTGHGTSSFQSIYFDFVCVCVCVWAEGKVGGSFPSVCFATSRHVERRPTSSRVLFFRHYDFFFISWWITHVALLTNFVECQQSLVCVDLITPEVECTPRYFLFVGHHQWIPFRHWYTSKLLLFFLLN
jgi:hypothetical protein